MQHVNHYKNISKCLFIKKVVIAEFALNIEVEDNLIKRTLFKPYVMSPQNNNLRVNKINFVRDTKVDEIWKNLYLTFD